jgi:hypothetical protein
MHLICTSARGEICQSHQGSVQKVVTHLNQSWSVDELYVVGENSHWILIVIPLHISKSSRVIKKLTASSPPLKYSSAVWTVFLFRMIFKSRQYDKKPLANVWVDKLHTIDSWVKIRACDSRLINWSYWIIYRISESCVEQCLRGGVSMRPTVTRPENNMEQIRGLFFWLILCNGPGIWAWGTPFIFVSPQNNQPRIRRTTFLRGERLGETQLLSGITEALIWNQS